MNKNWPIIISQFYQACEVLEKELEELFIHQHLSEPEYQERTKKVSVQRSKISMINTRFYQVYGELLQTQTPFIYDFVESRTEDEKIELIRYLKKQNQVYQKLSDMNQKVIYLAQKVSVQGLGIFDFLPFSKLKSFVEKASTFQQSIASLKKKQRISAERDVKRLFFEIQNITKECSALKESILIQERGFQRDKKDFFSGKNSIKNDFFLNPTERSKEKIL